MELYTLIDNFKTLSDRVSGLKDELSMAQAQLQEAKDALATAMTNDEVQNISRGDFTYSLVNKTKYSKKGGSDEELFEVLKKNGLGDLVQPSVNAMRLNSAMNEIAEQNDGELPPEFENVINSYSFLDISKRKRAKK